jgi:hypothetical protein
MTLLLAFLLLTATGPAPVRLLPIDQCRADASFNGFRADLAQAIESKDKQRLLSLVADDIMIDFGGGHGRSAFADKWQLERPAESLLWAEIGEILRLGCTIEGDTAAAPSLMHQLPADRDAFTTLLAVNPGSALHEAPRDDSAMIRRLDWDLLTLADKGGAEGWFPVRLDDGRTGYVRQEHVRSPIDYRAVFARRDGRWRMTVLVAGD